MDLSILLPTTGRRSEMLTRVVHAYGTRCGQADIEVLTIEGHTWGTGLNLLAKKAQGSYWFCGADDALPQGGWFDAGRAFLDVGKIPAARFYEIDGTPQNPRFDAEAHGAAIYWTRFFLLTPAIYEQVGPFLDASWYLDFDYSERLMSAGFTIHACDGFSFVHLNGERDWLDEETDRRDYEVWQAAVKARELAAS